MRNGNGADSAFNDYEQRRRQGKPDAWPEPVDFLTNREHGAPQLQECQVPASLWAFAHDTSARMGVDPTSVAMSALVSCASVTSDEWRIQPKRHDTAWTEQARLWGAIVGLPSILKTPVIVACTKPIERLDAAARDRHREEMREYKIKRAAWNLAADKDIPEPRQPKLARYMVEGTTIEALSEVLRNDDEAHQYAPAHKVLSRHDEMAEFIANLDRYRVGGRGGGDRGAYLRLCKRWPIRHRPHWTRLLRYSELERLPHRRHPARTDPADCQKLRRRRPAATVHVLRARDLPTRTGPEAGSDTRATATPRCSPHWQRCTPADQSAVIVPLPWCSMKKLTSIEKTSTPSAAPWKYCPIPRPGCAQHSVSGQACSLASA